MNGKAVHRDVHGSSLQWVVPPLEISARAAPSLPARSLRLTVYRWRLTPTRRQYPVTGHWEQRGLIGAHNAWPKGTDVSVRLVRAIAAACKAEPSLNAWYDSQETARRLHKKIDLGIAVDTDEGLFVPVLNDIANRAAADLPRGLAKV
ncbi:MAG: 2-oxo acid dehydrogenase subunit E2, partial [SAR324 cluster bacterium]|nr:2-oxo acid dehydrogenase subunit E2 [SAR324 cluster bacterium]